ncbi:hypothetical protein [Streptomyces phaeochromogenes]
MKAADVSRRLRGFLEAPETETNDPRETDEVPDISSLTQDSPIGESGSEASNSKADALAVKDIERLEAVLAALKAAAKKVHRSVARRAVETQPDVAVPLIQEIGATLQQIDRAVAIRLRSRSDLTRGRGLRRGHCGSAAGDIDGPYNGRRCLAPAQGCGARPDRPGTRGAWANSRCS